MFSADGTFGTLLKSITTLLMVYSNGAINTAVKSEPFG